MAQVISFLDLPSGVRVKIYTLLGLVRHCPIDLLKERYRKKDFSERDGTCRHSIKRHAYGCLFPRRQRGHNPVKPTSELECYCPPLPLELLYLSHAVHAEVEAILYGCNKFKIQPEIQKDLVPLWNLSSNAFLSLTSLHISLDGSHGEELWASVASNAAFITEWAELCTFMADMVAPSQVNFSLSYDCYSSATAVQVLEPILQWPRMKSCAIRLGQLPDEEFRWISKKISLVMSGKPASLVQPFPFEKLPKEIRLQILRSTDLIARWDKTQWYQNGMHILDGKIHYRKQCCTKCTDSLDSCCCGTLEAAFSLRCDCFQFPVGLFYVNKQIYSEAREVCYSKNRFIFEGDPNFTWKLLRGLRLGSLGFVRNITFLFTDGQKMAQWNHKTEDARKSSSNWQVLVQFVQSRLLLSKLSITIDARSMVQDYLRYEDVDDLLWVYHAYQRIVSPFRQIRGLRRFHVLLSAFYEYEAIAEKEVMGETYDSEQDGKIPLRERTSPDERERYSPLPRVKAMLEPL